MIKLAEDFSDLLASTQLKDATAAVNSVGRLEDICFKDTLKYNIVVGVVRLGYLKPKDITSFLKKCQKSCQRLIFFESVGTDFTANTGYTVRNIDFYKAAFEKANWECYSCREVTFPP